MADRALDHPAVPAQPRAVLDSTPSDRMADSACVQQPPVLVVVIATVGDHSFGAMAWPTDWAFYMRDRVHQRDQLGHIIAVGRSGRPRQQQAAGIG